MMAKLKNVTKLSSKSDEELEKFWDRHEPEDFEGWQDGNLKFKLFHIPGTGFVFPPGRLGQVPDDLVPVREVVPVFSIQSKACCLLEIVIITTSYSFEIQYFIHHKVAKDAEKSYYMFAVERTANIKDSSSQMKIMFKNGRVKIAYNVVARRACFLAFWPLSRKFKEKILSDLCGSSEAPRSGMRARAVNQCLTIYAWLSSTKKLKIRKTGYHGRK